MHSVKIGAIAQMLPLVVSHGGNLACDSCRSVGRTPGYAASVFAAMPSRAIAQYAALLDPGTTRAVELTCCPCSMPVDETEKDRSDRRDLPLRAVLELGALRLRDLLCLLCRHTPKKVLPYQRDSALLDFCCCARCRYWPAARGRGVLAAASIGRGRQVRAANIGLAMLGACAGAGRRRQGSCARHPARASHSEPRCGAWPSAYVRLPRRRIRDGHADRVAAERSSWPRREQGSSGWPRRSVSHVRRIATVSPVRVVARSSCPCP